MYIGFEKERAEGSDSIHNYDAMKVFRTEKEAMDYVNANPEYRTYKYCPLGKELQWV